MPPGVSGSPGGTIIGAEYMISVTAPHNLTSRIPDCFSRPTIWVIRSEVECGSWKGCGRRIVIPVRRRFRRAKMPSDVWNWKRSVVSLFFTAFSWHSGWIYSVLSFQSGVRIEAGPVSGSIAQEAQSPTPTWTCHGSLETEATRDALQEIDE